MGRRSDHSRAELEALILDTGHQLMAEVGYARFSAREVAKRIGYSVGTIHNVCGGHDRLVMTLNSRTFTLWAAMLRERLAENPPDRIAVLVASYFAFAAANPKLWMAIYDHRLPEGETLPEEQQAQRGELTGIIAEEVRRVLPEHRAERAASLARSLVATVHGHCVFALTGAFALMGESDPQGAALARVREALAAAQGF